MRLSLAVFYLSCVSVVAVFLAAHSPVFISDDFSDDLTLAPEMQVFYQQVNNDYFKSKLPHADIFWSRELIGSEGYMGVTMGVDDGTFVIFLDQKMRDDGYGRTSLQTVIHEECHISVWPDTTHGAKFQACMLKLANEKAFYSIW